MKQDGDKKDLALELAKIKAEDELQRDEQAKNKAKASIFLGEIPQRYRWKISIPHASPIVNRSPVEDETRIASICLG